MGYKPTYDNLNVMQNANPYTNVIFAYQASICQVFETQEQEITPAPNVLSKTTVKTQCVSK